MDDKLDWKAEYEKELARGEALKEHVQATMIRAAVEAEAKTFGMIYLDLAVKLADMSGCSFDEDSDVVVGASEAVQRLIAEKPFLFSPKIKSPPPPPSMWRKEVNELLDQIHREIGFKKS